jgi:hypothetical protein
VVGEHIQECRLGNLQGANSSSSHKLLHARSFRVYNTVAALYFEVYYNATNSHILEYTSAETDFMCSYYQWQKVVTAANMAFRAEVFDSKARLSSSDCLLTPSLAPPLLPPSHSTLLPQRYSYFLRVRTDGAFSGEARLQFSVCLSAHAVGKDLSPLLPTGPT